MKKIILCDGDSWTAGDIIDPKLEKAGLTYINDPKNDKYRLPKVWPHKLGKLLSIVPGLEDIEVWNAAVAGCSNDAIVRRVVENTFKLLDDYKPEEIFVVVGWSSPERKDFHYDYDGVKHWETFYPHAILDPEQLGRRTKDQQEFYKSYVKYYWNEEEYFSRYIHNNLYLHYFLKVNNIQHMFFDAFYQTEFGHHHNYEMRTDGVATEHKFLEITKDIYKNTSFKNFMIDYRSGIGKASDRRYDFKQGLFSKDNSHPSENAHQLWAEELFKDLKGKINA